MSNKTNQPTEPKKRKPAKPTLQIVMSEREQDLLTQLADKLQVTKTAILVECAKLAIESV